jgi:hypothetical protein
VVFIWAEGPLVQDRLECTHDIRVHKKKKVDVLQAKGCG